MTRAKGNQQINRAWSSLNSAMTSIAYCEFFMLASSCMGPREKEGRWGFRCGRDPRSAEGLKRRNALIEVARTRSLPASWAPQDGLFEERRV